MEKVAIEAFLLKAKENIVLDVRSPGEYAHAHIPGAYNLPLFSDDERKVVGTAYKEQGREIAIKIGLDFFGVKMRKMVEEVEGINSKFQIPNSKSPKTVLVHCWRGGMRSAGVAWLLDLYGFKVYTLEGGYKSFRNWALQQFEVRYPFNVLGGYTGSGKTEVLKELAKSKLAIVDLEGIARHKGSAFGDLGQEKQPTQEMFENELATQLHGVASMIETGQKIWIEDESRRIGTVNIPGALWDTMRSAPAIFLEIPFEARLNHITEGYGKFEKKDLINGVLRIQKRLGGQGAKDAVNYLLEGNNKECFRILLRYYDKYYSRDMELRITHSVLSVISRDEVDARTNSEALQLMKRQK